jgi:hypothetical protein
MPSAVILNAGCGGDGASKAPGSAWLFGVSESVAEAIIGRLGERDGVKEERTGDPVSSYDTGLITCREWV